MGQGNKLTAAGVKGLKKPGRYGDGNGLWLQVRGPENRSWLYRYMVAGKAKWLGLGDERAVSLAMARQLSSKAREMIAAGLDPIEVKHEAREARKAAQATKTFDETAKLYIAANEVSWKNEKHRDQWRNTLQTYASPIIGKMRITEIKTDHILKVLEPIWQTKAETASRVRGRIESVLDFATARGWRTGENPARWRGHLDHILPAKSKVAAVEHHAARPWPEMPEFFAALSRQQGIGAQALQFAILTAARSGEVRGAVWSEIDLKNKVWTVPAARMKAGRAHRVPLTDSAIAILKAAQPLGGNGDDIVFPGVKAGKALSDMSLSAVLRRMERVSITVHGFRSTFRDWSAESTSFPREIAEAALAHRNGNKVESAYLRSDHFEKRRDLMEQWAAHCTSN
jgi:integrase